MSILESFQALRRANAKRDLEWIKGTRLPLLFRTTELAGEIGELCNKVKKLWREQQGISGSRTTREAVAEEIADCFICLDLLAMDLNIDAWPAIVAKFNATSEERELATRLDYDFPPTPKRVFYKECKQKVIGSTLAANVTATETEYKNGQVSSSSGLYLWVREIPPSERPGDDVWTLFKRFEHGTERSGDGSTRGVGTDSAGAGNEEQGA